MPSNDQDDQDDDSSSYLSEVEVLEKGICQQDADDDGVDEGEGEGRHPRHRSDESMDSVGSLVLHERLSALTISSSSPGRRRSQDREDGDGGYEEEDALGIFRDAGSDEEDTFENDEEGGGGDGASLDESSVVYYPFTPGSKKNSMEGLGLGLGMVGSGGMGGGLGPRKWIHKDMKTDWKIVNSIAIPIIHKFTTRTNGSCISPRVPGVCWSYFGADPEWGEKQAAQLTVELETALVNYDVKIQAQKGHVEVLPRNMHKGKVVTEFLQKITKQRAGKLPSFILVAGADPADSEIFDSVYQQIAECRPQDGIETCAAFSVHVGAVDNYSAGAFVPAVEDMQELLVALAASDSTDKSVEEGKHMCSMVIDGSVQ